MRISTLVVAVMLLAAFGGSSPTPSHGADGGAGADQTGSVNRLGRRGARRDRVVQQLQDRLLERTQRRAAPAGSRMMIPNPEFMILAEDETTGDETEPKILPPEPCECPIYEILPVEFEDSGEESIWEGPNGDEGCIVDWECMPIDDVCYCPVDDEFIHPLPPWYLDPQIYTLSFLRGNESGGDAFGPQGHGAGQANGGTRIENMRDAAPNSSSSGAGRVPEGFRERGPADLPLADRLLAKRLADIDHLRDIALRNGNEKLLEKADQLEQLARQQHGRRTDESGDAGDAGSSDPMTETAADATEGETSPTP